VLIAFDVFGTLADPASVARELVGLCGGDAPAGGAAPSVAAAWRATQLEYMFRATAMGLFPPFADLTRWALQAALDGAGIAPPDGADLAELAQAYRRLTPFDDVAPALRELHARGHRLVAFSVGPRAWLEDLTRPYRELVDDIVSAEGAGVYKPHPGIYRHLLEVTGTDAADTLLVSGNPFDIVGGAAVGLATAWCRRQVAARFDRWGTGPACPDHVVGDLGALCGLDLPVAPRRAPGQPGGAAASAARYGELTAAVYDELYAGAFDTEGAVDALAELTGAGVLLDLGAGTGRLVVPLAQRGVRVEGIEASPSMIARLRAHPVGRAVPLHEGDFADVDAPGPYAVIVAAVSTLFMLGDQGTQARCLRNAAARLAPDGVLVVEAFVPDPRRYDADGRRTETRRLTDDRLHVVQSRHDPVAQRVHIEHVLVEGGTIRRYPVTLRYAPPAELDLMASAAGLACDGRFGGWRRQPFTAATTDHVTLYRRAGG
jgi:2-haloalkanoic acid dehalogenase type II